MRWDASFAGFIVSKVHEWGQEGGNGVGMS